MTDAMDRFPLDAGPAQALPLAAVDVAPRTSASRMVADALRAAIVDGRLPPGAPLRQDAVARHFSVSAIPVREALRQLESEGWAKVEMHKGATVAPLSAFEAREIYEIRAALEGLALTLAIPQHTEETLREVQALYEAAELERDPALYVARNEAFHMGLYAPAGRPQLLEMIGTLHRRGERYLRVKFGLPEHKRVSDDEHGQLMRLVRRKEVAAAQKLIADHLLGTGELLYRLLSEPAAAPSGATRKRGKTPVPQAGMFAPKKRAGRGNG
ncbi:GntR family transcriptional regulator [Trinickia diaoshuihuensis]|uniref:GntR family transcriptional regulator n=1 Tax=Trinickia diaoshuihuensis TaxID=2292265 RepID=UPI000E247F15|nr:GntR family transcriptional regulator [Trinickia diaoshuihuensis]